VGRACFGAFWLVLALFGLADGVALAAKSGEEFT
jgi:hypothetical protein